LFVCVVWTLKNYINGPHFYFPFQLKKIILTKNGWAAFGAISSQTHLVTLLKGQPQCQSAIFGAVFFFFKTCLVTLHTADTKHAGQIIFTSFIFSLHFESKSLCSTAGSK
jgi:hypothetical protein